MLSPEGASRKGGMFEYAAASHCNLVVTQGTSIPCVLETAMSSDVAGFVSCVVLRDVMSDSGNVVLMEKGTQVVGEYRGNVRRGSKRMFVLWTLSALDKVVLPEPVAPEIRILRRVRTVRRRKVTRECACKSTYAGDRLRWGGPRSSYLRIPILCLSDRLPTNELHIRAASAWPEQNDWILLGFATHPRGSRWHSGYGHAGGILSTREMANPDGPPVSTAAWSHEKKSSLPKSVSSKSPSRSACRSIFPAVQAPVGSARLIWVASPYGRGHPSITSV